jgi:hypothetical protein
MAAMIKFEPPTLIDRELIVLAATLLSWATYWFVEKPFRFGRPVPLKAAFLGGAMALVALAAFVVYEGGGFEFRLPAEIRAMANVEVQSAQWRIHRCLLDLAHESAFAENCAEPNRRPLLMLWGDSAAGALMPGLRKAQEAHDFAIAQFTASSCIPALNVDIVGVPNCRANNGRVLELALKLKPDIVLLHGAWQKHLDHVAETVVTLREKIGARVIVLGPVPMWRRGMPNEVLRYYLLHHSLIPERSNQAVTARGYNEEMREALTPRGAEFISAVDALCNEAGCLARIGNEASDITASDQVHLTEKGSIFLVQSIIDRVLSTQPAPSARMSQ